MSRHCTLLFFRFLWCSFLFLGLFGCAAPNTDLKGIGFLPSFDGFVFGTVPEKERIAIKTKTHAELSGMVVQACGVARAERADQQYIGQDQPTRTVMTTRLSRSYEARVRELLGLAPIPEPESPAPETPLRPIEHPAVQGGAGLVSGTAIGFVPGGPIGADLAIRAELLPEGTRPARVGKACGELIAGVTQIVVGCGGMGTGIGMSGTGGGAIVGVPVFVGSLGLTLNGVSTCAVGAQHLLVEIWHPKDDPPVATSPETSAPPAAKPPQQTPPTAKPPQQTPPAAKPPQQAPPAAKPPQQAPPAAKPPQQAASATTNGHHPWPKYLGGPVKQDLAKLPESLHKAYHTGLDKILPRQRGTAYYDNLSTEAKKQLIGDLAAYTKAFDAKHGTHLYDSMVRNGFPAP